MKKVFLFFAVFSLLFAVSSCSDDDEIFANVTINELASGEIDGDLLGNGGSFTRAFTWDNSQATADYNADITSSAVGVFDMVVEDADGTVVLDRTLNGSEDVDSFSGVTSAGIAGTWTVTITLTNFSGDGSFSLSAGN